MIAEQPELDPLNEEARRSLWHFEHLAAEKEKQKTKEEMIGKLKESGNSVQRQFRMSVGNFKAVKDPQVHTSSNSKCKIIHILKKCKQEHVWQHCEYCSKLDFLCTFSCQCQKEKQIRIF